MRIGPYEVVATLGKGGTGVVHAARSPDGRAVAVKVLRRCDGEIVARFERERRLLAALGEAEGFVPLLDAGTTPEGPYLVMPLVPGGTLRRKLEAGRLAIDETVALGRRLGLALGAAHARGIVHRDMKPENVLFTAGGLPLVADLGLAKHFDGGAPGASQSVSLSQHGVLRGTAGYMAPEQMNDARSVGPPADVFALGVILYECLAGEPPFVGGTLIEVIQRVAEGRVTPLRERRPEVPGWLVAVLERALERAPERRFADGAAVARALAARSPGRRGPALVALACVPIAIAAALALRAGNAPPPDRPAPATPPRAPGVDLVTRFPSWEKAPIPATELAATLRDFPGSGERLALEAFRLGISGPDLSPEVRKAFRTRGPLAEATRAVETLGVELARPDGQARLRAVLVPDAGSRNTDPVARAWHAVFGGDRHLAATYPALVAPILPAIEAYAVSELSRANVRKGLDAPIGLVKLEEALRDSLDPSTLSPVLRGSLALALVPANDAAVRARVGAMLEGGLALVARNEPDTGCGLVCSAVHRARDGDCLTAELRAVAPTAHRLIVERLGRDTDPRLRQALADEAFTVLIDAYDWVTGPEAIAALHDAYLFARKELGSEEETRAACALVDTLIRSKETARVDELLPEPPRSAVAAVLAGQACRYAARGDPAKAREALDRAHGSARDMGPSLRVDQLLERAEEYVQTPK
jgi:hypothetical protein